jgi:tRNA threonylcarbamoyladenosine biosynthesis protein TsaE
MLDRKITSNSLEETYNIAARLALILTNGDVISMEGQLGAGKTAFVKGLAFGLGVKDSITSPTFVILKQYNGNLELNHFDVYRINEKEFSDLGYRDFFYSDSICIVEWGDRIKNLLPEEVLILQFDYGRVENQRIITVKPKGKTWEKKVEKWLS